MPQSDRERELERAETTGRLLAAVVKLEKSVGDLEPKIDILMTEEATRRGSTRVWRMLGASAATIALTIATAALSLAFEASADHVRLQRVEGDLSEFQAAEAAEELRETEHDREIDSTVAAAHATIETTKAILERVERRLDEMDARDRARRR